MIVALQCQQHEDEGIRLSSGKVGGFFLGDGAGVGELAIGQHMGWQRQSY